MYSAVLPPSLIDDIFCLSLFVFVFVIVICHLEGVKFLFQYGFSWSYWQKSWVTGRKGYIGVTLSAWVTFSWCSRVGPKFRIKFNFKATEEFDWKSVDESRFRDIKGRDDSQCCIFFTCTRGLSLKGGHYLVFKGKAVLYQRFLSIPTL